MSYTLQQNLGSSPNDYGDLGSAAASQWRGYSFTATGYTLTQVGVDLEIGGGSPLTSALNCYLYSDSGGSGPSSLLATATNTISSTLTASYVYYLFQFSGYTVNNGTRYWIVLKITTVDGSNYGVWGALDTGSEASYYSGNGTSWTSDSGASFQGTIQTYITSSSAMPISWIRC